MMSRRTGLGRGLAALIPPADRRERDGSTTPADSGPSGPGQRPDGTDGSPAPAVAAPGTTSDRDGPGGEPGDADAAGHDLGAGAALDEDTETTFRIIAASGRPDAGASISATPSPASGRPPSPVPAATATYAEIAPSDIRPNPRQPRDVFDPEEIEGLAVSLADIGVLQPLVVRPLGDDAYELIAGERRLRAATLAGLDVVPVLIRHTDDADLLKEALVENIHRVQLNPLEEAAAFEQLLEEFGVTQEELAARLGKSRPAISNTLRLLKLPPAVQRRVAAGVLSAGHAKALLTLDDTAAQTRLAERIVAEGLSVRATEEVVRLRMLDGSDARPRPKRGSVTAPGLVELQDDLSDALEARVRISMGARKGKLTVEFGSVDELERIVGVIADGLGHGRAAGRIPRVDTDIAPA
jgi:ParB family transcriptional regulator, chromosome partitioning protein